MISGYSIKFPFSSDKENLIIWHSIVDKLTASLFIKGKYYQCQSIWLAKWLRFRNGIGNQEISVNMEFKNPLWLVRRWQHDLCHVWKLNWFCWRKLVCFFTVWEWNLHSLHFLVSCGPNCTSFYQKIWYPNNNKMASSLS